MNADAPHTAELRACAGRWSFTAAPPGFAQVAPSHLPRPAPLAGLVLAFRVQSRAAEVPMLAPAALLPLLAQLALAPSAPASPEPTAIATSPATAIPRLQAGVGFMWLPTAVLMPGLSGERAASPAANTLGIVPSIDRRVSSHLSLGLAAPVLFNVKGTGTDGDGSNEVDLLLRLTGWLPHRPLGAPVRGRGSVLTTAPVSSSSTRIGTPPANLGRGVIGEG